MLNLTALFLIQLKISSIQLPPNVHTQERTYGICLAQYQSAVKNKICIAEIDLKKLQ